MLTQDCSDYKYSREYMLECEAKTWMRLVQKHGRAWWLTKKEFIRKKRGDSGVKILVDEMNRLRTLKNER